MSNVRSQMFLRPLIGSRKQHEISVYDLETTTDLERVYLVGFYDGTEYRYFESVPMRPEVEGSAVDQFMLWILKSRTHCDNRIYAHNGGNFDALYLVRWLLERRKNYSFTVVPIQSTLLSVQVVDKKTKSKWNFLDSRRLVDGSLDSLGKAFGLGGKVGDIDYDTLHLDPRRYEYLERDCRLLHGVVSKFYDVIANKGGEVGVTAPATAMNHFRRVHLDSSISTDRHFGDCKDSECRGCVHAFVRRGYYGGRVEVFREQFEGGIISLGDINSMYPSAMLEDMPVQLKMVCNGPVDLERFSKHYAGVIECTVHVPHDCYLPPLPYRSEEGKLLFPVGTFTGVWCWPELQNLFKAGGKITQLKTSLWFRPETLFRSYVEDWYSYRDTSHKEYDETMARIAKLMLNSLYGKFGQNEDREMLWFFPEDDVFADHQLEPIEGYQDGVYSEKIQLTAAYAIPHIAAWVTSLARAKLWTIMHEFLQRGYKIWYCDTDSVVTDAPIEASTKLGELKLECQITKARFVSPKLYMLHRVDGATKIKAKGFGGGFGRGPLTEEKFNEVVVNRQKVQIQKMTKLREGLRNNNQFPAMKTVTKGLNKKLAQLDTKREHLLDGNTRPLVVQE